MMEIENILSEKGINPTPVRKLVYKGLAEADYPLSLSDLEIMLDTVDKSTISRALAIFRQHNLIHSFSDGSSSTKYELCDCHHADNSHDFHVHFRCEICGETICLTELKVPIVQLPEGYRIHEINYVISGVCSNCS